MKFAHQLKALEGSAAQEWRGKFIHYKDLKKAIKLCKYVRVLSHMPPTLVGLLLTCTWPAIEGTE